MIGFGTNYSSLCFFLSSCLWVNLLNKKAAETLKIQVGKDWIIVPFFFIFPSCKVSISAAGNQFVTFFYRCVNYNLAHNTLKRKSYSTQYIAGIIIASIPNKTFSHRTCWKRYTTRFGGIYPVQSTICF